AIGARELFLEHGGANFTFVPCLNAADDHIALLAELVRRELAGWVSSPAGSDPMSASRSLDRDAVAPVRSNAGAGPTATSRR
ncbi:MAG: hypothetical protein ACREIR_00980, partial [Geminicoccaceae bacterium]